MDVDTVVNNTICRGEANKYPIAMALKSHFFGKLSVKRVMYPLTLTLYT